MKKTIWKFLFWAYVLTVFLVVILKFTGSFQDLFARMQADPYGRPYNLEPFSTLGIQLQHLSEDWAKFNLIGNTIPFIPFGFLLTKAYRRKYSLLKGLFFGFLFVLIAEIVQFQTKLGIFDVDDIILNMTAIFVGYIPVGISGVFRKAKRKKKK